MLGVRLVQIGTIRIGSVVFLVTPYPEEGVLGTHSRDPARLHSYVHAFTYNTHSAFTRAAVVALIVLLATSGLRLTQDTRTSGP